MDHPTRRLDDPAEAHPDQPTQRLDAPPGDPLADYHVPPDEAHLRAVLPTPPPRPCLRCQTPMITANVGIGSSLGPGNITVLLYQFTGQGLLRPQTRDTDCYAWVCPACGYTELVAKDPAVLLEP